MKGIIMTCCADCCVAITKESKYIFVVIWGCVLRKPTMHTVMVLVTKRADLLPAEGE